MVYTILERFFVTLCTVSVQRCSKYAESQYQETSKDAIVRSILTRNSGFFGHSRKSKSSYWKRNPRAFDNWRLASQLRYPHFSSQKLFPIACSNHCRKTTEKVHIKMHCLHILANHIFNGTCRVTSLMATPISANFDGSVVSKSVALFGLLVYFCGSCVFFTFFPVSMWSRTFLVPPRPRVHYFDFLLRKGMNLHVVAIMRRNSDPHNRCK